MQLPDSMANLLSAIEIGLYNLTTEMHFAIEDFGGIMCCRYGLGLAPEIEVIVDEMNKSPLVGEWNRTVSVKSSGEIYPTDVVPVIAPNREGKRAVFPMRWGFSGKTILMNARSETAASKPAFREAWERHRCIVPASCYYEWEHLIGSDGKKRTGEKYRIRPRGAAMTWLCGLYRIENGLTVFVILTREPGEEIRFIHDRMPLIMPEVLVNEWVRPDARPEELAAQALTDMVYEKEGNA